MTEPRKYAGPGDTVPPYPPTKDKRPGKRKRWLFRAIVAGVSAGVAWALKALFA